MLDAIRLIRNAIIEGNGKSRYVSLTLTALEQAELWWMKEKNLI